MADARDGTGCQAGDHDLVWDEERGRLECEKCGMSSDAIMRQPSVSDR